MKKIIKQKIDKKVSEEELRNLQHRKILLDQKNFEAFVVRNEYSQYIKMVLDKYECDPEKNYDINLNTGEINESIAVKE